MARSSLIPGFRFHPTDVELAMYYLKRKLLGKKIAVNAVDEVNIYEFSPWDLPDKSTLKSGDLEWYFFCPKSKKYSTGSRANRSTEAGFWKATGKDRKITYDQRTVATIKTLVFHLGHAGKGERTDWVMHEYKMEDEHMAVAGIVQDLYVLCKVFKKSGSGPKNGEQYGAPFFEEEWGDDISGCVDSQVVAGPVLISDIVNPTPTGSSVVTFFANQPLNTLNDKQKGPALINMTEPDSSVVTFSTDQPTCKLKDKHKGPVAMNMAGSQTNISFLKDNDMPAKGVIMFSEDDVMFFEDLYPIIGSEDTAKVDSFEKGKSVVLTNEADGIYEDLVNLIDLDELHEIDFKIDASDYTVDKLLKLDDVDGDLREFYVD
ncbi:hypothetical protein SSX86_001488 [Deinandra increscens subsp. villosa]|uniref:NAC domain-containing protein n=1 Tax=Deinandra increscens subsp. villosa TaxID=3103831 RepID=A0AAP0HEK9_9ASTR